MMVLASLPTCACVVASLQKRYVSYSTIDYSCSMSHHSFSRTIVHTHGCPIFQAGLSCQGCGSGVLLIKSASTTGHLFWGCSNYQKGGCRSTRPFGPPHDRQAAIQLEQIHWAQARKRAQEARIVDVHEQEWRAMCMCNGAENLNTFECYARSEGGCGFLPICPDCGCALFLKNGRTGCHWECQQAKKNKKCRYTKQYDEPRKSTFDEPSAKRLKPAPAAESTVKHLQDTSNRHTTTPPTRIRSPSALFVTKLTPEQKEVIEANRQAAFAKLQIATKGGIARAPRVSLTPFKSYDSPSRLSQKTTSSSEPNDMSEAKWPAKLNLGQKEGASGRVSASSTPERHFQSPLASFQKGKLTPEQKILVEAKRQAALTKRQSATKAAASDDVAPASPSSSRKNAGAPTGSTAALAIIAETAAAGCKNLKNEPLYQAFRELSQLYRQEGNYNAAQTYTKVSLAILNLSDVVTEANALCLGKNKTKVPHIGLASAEKMHEFVTTGRIIKLEEKRALWSA